MANLGHILTESRNGQSGIEARCHGSLNLRQQGSASATKVNGIALTDVQRMSCRSRGETEIRSVLKTRLPPHAVSRRQRFRAVSSLPGVLTRRSAWDILANP